ncbi:CU044_5270 family protein [Actinokineospora guangxiensis]|uniref:CU044_5270 family protein n=1 Tax=Actinokineospora guangxiensis TaxID=1490288 RepID=A0ABW0EX55_9PSEU
MPELWTDRELDQAIADQPAGPALSPAARAKAAAAMEAAFTAELTPSPRRTRLVAAAAVVAAVAGGLFAVQAIDGDAPAASADASLALAASNTLGTPDAPLAEGQYRYLARQAWDMSFATTATDKPLAVLIHSARETWVPADRAEEWLRRDTTHGWTWMVGDEALARAEGDNGLLGSLRRTSADQRGACGDFPDDNGELGGTPDDGKPCAERRGSWDSPAPAFLDALPRDPAALYSDLIAEADGVPATALYLATGVLASPDATPPLRAAVYEALTRLPGLETTDNAANLDGRVGTALGVAHSALRYEIIIDPGTGLLIGDRTVLLDPDADPYYAGLAEGTPIGFSSVTIAVAPDQGAVP